MTAIDGVLVVDKPRGPTSHDIVSRVRRVLLTRAVGHAGTLDPMATGVLVIAIGQATKLVPWLTAHDKAYEAAVTLGVETDTLDADGREVRRIALSDAVLDSLRRSGGRSGEEDSGTPKALEPGLLALALEQERERTLQVPPRYSAIHADGERAFARARRGEALDLAPRAVAVRRLELLAARADPPSLELLVETGKGYYVRSLARDLAEALGTVGHLAALRRTRSGSFVIAEAVRLDRPSEELRARVEPLARAAARTLPAVRLTEAGAREARHGRRVATSEMQSGGHGADHDRWWAEIASGPSAWFDPPGALVAVGQLEGAEGRVLRGFRETVAL